MGNVESKTKELGGNRNIVTNDPEIMSFEITPSHDFVVLGSSEVFSQFSNKKVSECLWKIFNSQNQNLSIHTLAGLAAESVLKNVLLADQSKNVSAVVIVF